MRHVAAAESLIEAAVVRRRSNHPTQWRLIKEFLSAHWGATGDSSSYRSHGNGGTTAYQRVWCSEGKHGMYQSQSACNNGGFLGADDCGDNRCDIVTEVFLKLHAGRAAVPYGPYLLYPGSSKTTPPSGTYNVWSGAKFGDATDYRSNFTSALSWCPVRCY